ncbi:hypothetical protein BGZ94_002440 [Podila epigama]|nr:hypothetical protein BGZ94_002440 [Podila epigama]
MVVIVLQLALLMTIVEQGYAQIFNGNQVVEPVGTQFIASDILPTFVPTTSARHSSDSKPNAGSSSSTAPSASSTPGPPIPIAPFTSQVEGGASPAMTGPLILPTTPAMFPQNITSCSTCYGMFSTLSRCNVVANTNTFPITTNTTYKSLMPFLKCICTYKALNTYPYCVDCFAKTQQPTQLNVLQANHLENYMDAFHQLCGVTYNGNRIPGSSAGLFLGSKQCATLTLVAIVISVVTVVI